MELKTLRYKKVYTVSEKTLEIVVSVFVEDDNKATVDQCSNYEKIVSKCLFPSNPTISLGFYQEDKLGERVNALLYNLTKYYPDKIMATFAHYHIVRYFDKVMLDETVVGINKTTNARGVVYTINDEKVTVDLDEDVKELSIDDDPAYEIDEDFKSMIESSKDKDKDKEESTDDEKRKKGGRKSIWWLLLALLIVALLVCMVAIIMLHRDHQNNEPPIITGDTIEQSDSTDWLPYVEDDGAYEEEMEDVGGDVGENERGSGVGKNVSPSPGGRNNGQDPVRKNGSGRPTNPSRVIAPADQSADIKVDKKQDAERGNVLMDTIGFPYGLYYGEYKIINGKRYPYGVGIMKYNQKTALRSTVPGWHYRYVKAGYELSGIWEGEVVKCGTLFDGSATRIVLDSVPCK